MAHVKNVCKIDRYQCVHFNVLFVGSEIALLCSTLYQVLQRLIILKCVFFQIIIYNMIRDKLKSVAYLCLSTYYGHI